MSALMNAAIAINGLNGLLALWLGSVYVRNHLEIKSPFTFAMMLFALFLVVHSALSIYHAVTMMATFTGQAEGFLLGESILESAALGALVYATMR